MEQRGNFGTKIGVILATAGSAVGLGNVWRFPYITGQDGGAVFIMVYLLCILFLGVPGMVSEFIIGRHSASNAARAYKNLADGRPWQIIGYIGIFTSTVILGFYAVVAGWCLQYLLSSLMGQVNGDAEYITTFFREFSTDAVRPLVWTIVFILITHFVVIRGVRRGIEKASNMLMPTLFVLLIILVVASCMLPGAWKGIDFLLNPDFSKMSRGVFLDALGQSFFSLSLGTACLCTYASYFSRRTDLAKSALQIAGIDTLIAVLAGLVIFPAAFSVGVNPDSGPSLLFITLPNVFQSAFGSMPVVCYLVSILFYALLTLAALTSTISMHEIGTAFFYEELHISRKKGACVQTTLCIIIGIFCSLSCGAVELNIFGVDFLGCCDYLTSNILMPVGALLTSVFVGWYVPRKIVYNEFTNWGTLHGAFFGLWLFAVRFVCPVCIIVIFLNQMGVFK